MIKSVMRCQRPWRDCYDMNDWYIGKLTEQSSTMTSWKSARRRRSPMVLCNGNLKIGYQLWQKDEELRKDFIIPWIQTLPDNSCSFEQFKDIQEMPLILSCKAMYCYQKIYWVHLPRREREWIEFNKQKWMNSREKKPQKEKTSCVLHYSESDGGWKWYGVKLHATWRIQGSQNTRNLGTAFKKRYFGAIWSSLKRKRAILPNTVTCSRSLQHTTCSWHWESGMYDNTRGAPPKGSLNSKIATGCTQSEFAMRSTRSTTPRQDHLGTHQANRRVTVKPGTTLLTTEFLAYHFRQLNNKIQHVKTRSRSSRTTSTRNPSFRTWARRRRSTSSTNNRKIRSLTWTTPRSSNFVKILPNSNVLSAMLNGKPVNLLQLWKKYEIFAETNRARTEKLRRHLSPWLCYQEEQQSRCQTRTFWTTKNVLPSERDAEKAWQKKHGCHPTILARWYASESYRTSLSDIGWQEKRHNAVWQNCLGETFLRRNKSWEKSKFEALDSHAKQRSTQATTQSTTWPCSCAKRIQTIARRAPGKDSARPQNWWNLPTASSPSSNWDENPLEDEQLEFPAFFKVWRFVIFSQSWDRFRLTGEKLPDNRRGVWTEHQLKQHVQMRTVCHNTYWTDWPHFITRTRVAQELEPSGLHIFVQNNCHPRVMCLSLPHLTLTTSTSSLSPASPTFPTISPTHTRPLAHDPCLPCEVPR